LRDVPTYEYEAVEVGRGCERCGARFEVVQRMDEAALERCPVCGGAVRRVLSVFGIGGPSGRSQLSDRNLKRLGFKKLVNEGGGRFRKAF
jgi:putative FmdB family regulatory protein